MTRIAGPNPPPEKAVEATGALQPTPQAPPEPPRAKRTLPTSHLPQPPKPQSVTQRDKEVDAALAALATGGSEELRAGLALAASYRLRRSSAARRRSLELCERLAQHAEVADVAEALAAVLTAEGEIYELDAAKTLAACARLVLLLEKSE